MKLIELDRHAEPFVHHLRVNGLMALAVRMGAGDDHERAARVEADHHAVVEYRGFFDEIADAAAAQLAVFLRFRGALGKPFQSASFRHSSITRMKSPLS